MKKGLVWYINLVELSHFVIAHIMILFDVVRHTGKGWSALFGEFQGVEGWGCCNKDGITLGLW